MSPLVFSFPRIKVVDGVFKGGMKRFWPFGTWQGRV